jgi:ABC-type multidrug transport system permease subunit
MAPITYAVEILVSTGLDNTEINVAFIVVNYLYYKIAAEYIRVL